MKMHLCGVLVHGLGLYCHIWVDAHHKQDNNQVITSIVKVLGDVKIDGARYHHPHSSRQLFTRKQKQVYVCVLRLPCGVGALSRGAVIFFDHGTYQ